MKETNQNRTSAENDDDDKENESPSSSSARELSLLESVKNFFKIRGLEKSSSKTELNEEDKENNRKGDSAEFQNRGNDLIRNTGSRTSGRASKKSPLRETNSQVCKTPRQRFQQTTNDQDKKLTSQQQAGSLNTQIRNNKSPKNRAGPIGRNLRSQPISETKGRTSESLNADAARLENQNSDVGNQKDFLKVEKFEILFPDSISVIQNSDSGDNLLLNMPSLDARKLIMPNMLSGGTVLLNPNDMNINLVDPKPDIEQPLLRIEVYKDLCNFNLMSGGTVTKVEDEFLHIRKLKVSVEELGETTAFEEQPATSSATANHFSGGALVDTKPTVNVLFPEIYPVKQARPVSPTYAILDEFLLDVQTQSIYANKIAF